MKVLYINILTFIYLYLLYFVDGHPVMERFKFRFRKKKTKTKPEPTKFLYTPKIMLNKKHVPEVEESFYQKEGRRIMKELQEKACDKVIENPFKDELKRIKKFVINSFYYDLRKSTKFLFFRENMEISLLDDLNMYNEKYIKPLHKYINKQMASIKPKTPVDLDTPYRRLQTTMDETEIFFSSLVDSYDFNLKTFTLLHISNILYPELRFNQILFSNSDYLKVFKLLSTFMKFSSENLIHKRIFKHKSLEVMNILNAHLEKLKTEEKKIIDTLEKSIRDIISRRYVDKEDQVFISFRVYEIYTLPFPHWLNILYNSNIRLNPHLSELKEEVNKFQLAVELGERAMLREMVDLYYPDAVRKRELDDFFERVDIFETAFIRVFYKIDKLQEIYKMQYLCKQIKHLVQSLQKRYQNKNYTKIKTKQVSKKIHLIPLYEKLSKQLFDFLYYKMNDLYLAYMRAFVNNFLYVLIIRRNFLKYMLENFEEEIRKPAALLINRQRKKWHLKKEPFLENNHYLDENLHKEINAFFQSIKTNMHPVDLEESQILRDFQRLTKTFFKKYISKNNKDFF